MAMFVGVVQRQGGQMPKTGDEADQWTRLGGHERLWGGIHSRQFHGEPHRRARPIDEVLLILQQFLGGVLSCW